MALIKCKECGAEVSSSAKACPKCGAKVKRPIGAAGVLVAIAIGGFAYLMFPAKEIVSATSSAVGPSPSNESPVRQRGWKYSLSDKDKMTGKAVKSASLISDTVLKFKFPYDGGSIPELSLTQTVGNGPANDSILLSVSKGQFVCGVEECWISVKFDDGEVIKHSARLLKGFPPNVIEFDDKDYQTYLNEARRTKAPHRDTFVEGLKKSKHLIIQANFFEQPYEQMEFSPAGLTW